MKKYFLLMVLVLVSQIYALPAAAEDIFRKYVKVIWIDQPRQMGVAYQDGIELFDFPIMTGDDEFTTDPGVYMVKLKVKDYYSRKYHSPMPYSIFFDLKEMKAIHEGEVPPPNVKKGLATHGCIHVELPDIERLYDWTQEEETVVVIDGGRTAN
jgi:lipoprotein-anchoring transpeptidase ErfK/SrfK